MKVTQINTESVPLEIARTLKNNHDRVWKTEDGELVILGYLGKGSYNVRFRESSTEFYRPSATSKHWSIRNDPVPGTVYTSIERAVAAAVGFLSD